MSIIATVYLPEGIAMATDSRLTGVTNYPNGNVDRHTLSDNSQKLFLIKNNSIFNISDDNIPPHCLIPFILSKEFTTAFNTSLFVFLSISIIILILPSMNNSFYLYY